VIWIMAATAGRAAAFFARDTLRAAWRRATRGGRRPAASRPGAEALSAQALLARCAPLARAEAPWSEIVAVVNPDADVQVDALLVRLRAVHRGVLAETLRAIEDGCRLALAENAEASAFDALSEASRRSPLATTARL
jgi:hypothetical protein